MRQRMRKSTISTKPSFDVKTPNLQHKNPQDSRLSNFLYKKGSMNSPGNILLFAQNESIRNTSKDSKKSQKRLTRQEFAKSNIPQIKIQRKSSIQSHKSMNELQVNQIEEKYERDPFMRAKIQSFIRQNSANKRGLNTYKVNHKIHQVPTSLKEKLDLNDFQFYSKYEKIRQKMGAS